MKLVVRGAIQISKDDKNLVEEATQRLFLTIIKENSIKFKDINSLILTQTKDIRSQNAATAVRKLQINEDDRFPLFCCQEADIEGSMPFVIRMLLQTDTRIISRKQAKHVYLDGASALRPDLAIKSATS